MTENKTTMPIPTVFDPEWVDHMLRVAHATHTAPGYPVPILNSLWASKHSHRRVRVIQANEAFVTIEFGADAGAEATLPLGRFLGTYTQV
jgi:hypothetical protein